MHTNIKLPCLLAAGLLGLAGCPGDDTGGGGGTDTDTNTNTMSASSTMSSTASTTASGTTPMTDTMTEPGTDTEPDTDTTTTTTGPDPDVYDFRDDDPGVYTQVDRMGLPAVNTALIVSPAAKDNYNAASNSAGKGVGGTWSLQMSQAIRRLHVGPDGQDQSDANGLNDDLAAALSLSVNEAVCFGESVGTEAGCFGQLGSLVPWFPTSGDSLQVDTEADVKTAAFPNGRRPADVVIDPILAAILLNLGKGSPLDVTSLVGVLNPTENTEGGNESFPYLVDAN